MIFVPMEATVGLYYHGRPEDKQWKQTKKLK